MIVTETVRLNGMELVYTASDAGVMIRKVGTEEIYSEAYDLPDAGYVYEETGMPVET